MKLADVLNGLVYDLLSGTIDSVVDRLTIDSRQATVDTLFVCIAGFQVDGHDFIDQAHARGATTFVVEKEVIVPVNSTVIKVSNSRQALATIAHRFYGKPNTGINMIGVTGTNGKTSVSFYIQSILLYHGQRTGLIGTVSTQLDHEVIDIKFATSTTPDTIELMQIIQYIKQKQAQHLVMEVTSHALALHKVDALSFDVSVFTNLTQDHLDLHGTMENYRDAKAKLFTMSDTSIINIDDPYGEHMKNMAKGKVMTYSIDQPSDLQATNITYSPTGSTFDLYLFGKVYHLNLPIAGRFSVYNALGSIGAAYHLGVPVATIQQALENFKTVPGRIDAVENDKNLNVIVDYSHTPDSLKTIILTVKAFTKGRVITVFGCGGDRDNAKRPLMAKEASIHGDFTIMTSDNPRTEDPEHILDQVEKGIIGEQYERITDREEAIHRAVQLMTPDDTVIIAGKGHETYQIFKDKTIDFDDKQVALHAINKLK